MNRLRISPDEDLALAFRWMTTRVIWKEVTALQNVAPLRLTVPAHGVPNGWPVALDLPKHQGPDIKDRAVVVSDDILELPNVNGSNLRAWSEGTYLRYLQPVDLAAVTITAKLIGMPHGERVKLEVTPQIEGDLIRIYVPHGALKPLGRELVLDLDAEDSSGRKLHLARYEIMRDLEGHDCGLANLFVVSAGEQGPAGQFAGIPDVALAGAVSSYLDANGINVNWGSITGNLTNQTDLQAALTDIGGALSGNTADIEGLTWWMGAMDGTLASAVLTVPQTLSPPAIEQVQANLDMPANFALYFHIMLL